MDERNKFVNFNLQFFGYETVEDLIENLYLRALIDSYSRIDKNLDIENKIRDKFIADLYTKNTLTKKWVQSKLLHINWERWVYSDKDEMGRADISFELPGLDFLLECKRLKYADKNYIDNGLNRFVELKYAEGDDYAGMIGLVVSGNISTIANNLKAKVKDNFFVSNPYDLLNEKCVGWKHSFQSKHHRTNNTQIHVYHLFFEFAKL